MIQPPRSSPAAALRPRLRDPSPCLPDDLCLIPSCLLYSHTFAASSPTSVLRGQPPSITSQQHCKASVFSPTCSSLSLIQSISRVFPKIFRDCPLPVEEMQVLQPGTDHQALPEHPFPPFISLLPFLYLQTSLSVYVSSLSLGFCHSLSSSSSQKLKSLPSFPAQLKYDLFGEGSLSPPLHPFQPGESSSLGLAALGPSSRPHGR